ncbi:hypothetical protein RclHR1_17720002 [Rhizophagus clarus]|uniref:G-protein coupled receptors family 2 profile 2 domain-containing protein n=1 Tax=Rhizophagus clarus TaxID=94130 RepID=A0A2Z6QPN4_9GLOM|nr:hypothetical protein RclHR1_17720002 [Rhizophagus clarus]
MVEFVDCAIKDEDLKINSRSQADSRLTVITSLILSQIDLVASLYILVRTYFQWKKNNKNSIPNHLKYPFYIALVELLISIFQTIDWSSSSASNMWMRPLCGSIGFISIFLLAFVMNLVTFISFITWYKVKKDIEFNSGRYDYIIFLISTGFSVFYTLLGVNKYGKAQYWCADQADNKTVLYIILVIIIIHASLLLTFYIDTRMHLRRFKTNKLSFNGQNLPAEDIKSYDRMMTKKVISYTLVYGCQLALLMFYIIISIGTIGNTAVSLIRILGITIGGFLVLIQYITNEGWKINPIPTRPLEKHFSRSSSQLTPPSIRDSDIQSIQSGFRLPFTRIQVEVVRQQTTTQQDDDWVA